MWWQGLHSLHPQTNGASPQTHSHHAWISSSFCRVHKHTTPVQRLGLVSFPTGLVCQLTGERPLLYRLKFQTWSRWCHQVDSSHTFFFSSSSFCAWKFHLQQNWILWLAVSILGFRFAEMPWNCHALLLHSVSLFSSFFSWGLHL